MSEAPLKLRSFNLTVSVRGDICDDCVKAVMKQVKKVAVFFHGCVENKTKEGNPCKKHLHVCFFVRTPMDGVKWKQNLWDRQVKKFHPDSIGRAAVQNQACPGDKWVREYLHKTGEHAQLVEMQLPNDLAELEEFYPTQEEQAKLQMLSTRVYDTFFSSHEVHYKAWLLENTWCSTCQTAMEYFHLRMFVRKDMPVNADSRKVHQWAVALHRYTTEDYKLTPRELRSMQEEAQDYAFEVPN